jgi:hypothetical protein
MTNEAAAIVIAEFNEAIAELESIIAWDVILAWDNGLAVRLVDGNVAATSIVNATSFGNGIDQELPVVTNGHGQRAKPIRRKDAVHFEVKKLRSLIATLEGRVD